MTWRHLQYWTVANNARMAAALQTGISMARLSRFLTGILLAAGHAFGVGQAIAEKYRVALVTGPAPRRERWPHYINPMAITSGW